MQPTACAENCDLDVWSRGLSLNPLDRALRRNPEPGRRRVPRQSLTLHRCNHPLPQVHRVRLGIPADLLTSQQVESEHTQLGNPQSIQSILIAL